MKVIHGGITAPIGFKANGLFCGIKRSKKKDLTLIVSDKPCDAVGAFTANQVQASCVVVNKENLRDGQAQAVIANSGNANCMTGESGFENTRAMAAVAARLLKIRKKDVMVASTGVIGKPLPIKKILAAVPELVKGLNRKGGEAAAAGILTTDRLSKEIAVEFFVGGRRVRVGAIAKGAGMIHPQMTVKSATKAPADPRHATMLCFVTTDAAITPAALRDALARAVDKTFNTITIDGDMSTNDMVLVLANGMAQNRRIAEKTKEFRLFSRALETIFLFLAKQMVRDAEGATKFVEVNVKNAGSREDARRVARSVASSNLFKCALFGSDPNWGRIAAAAGYADAHVDPWKLQIFLGKELVSKKGGRVMKQAVVLNRIFAQKNIKVTLDLGLGKYGATAYTCDLSTSYVRINSAYRT
ncbi:MAG: bifunctional glutamate N-acetyltransferase/amino-acid acetyltransferase ArgJ [Candidatus Omnitrophica bacterium]|nr:bifunctional glutamate N-acetyltransferase/amino-acid acetyltransferase ArgJ [Candidatus Omnitrophota bacterium]